MVDEWKRKVADLQAELEASQRDSRAHAAEVYKLKAQLEEAQDGAESLRREAKTLSGPPTTLFRERTTKTSLFCLQTIVES